MTDWTPIELKLLRRVERLERELDRVRDPRPGRLPAIPSACRGGTHVFHGQAPACECGAIDVRARDAAA